MIHFFNAKYAERAEEIAKDNDKLFLLSTSLRVLCV
jgi:hypothetical protein